MSLDNQQDEDQPRKACGKCKVIKYATLEFFYKDASSKTGLTSYCRECALESSTAWQAANPKRVMIQNARLRARKAGIPFDITEDDIHIPTYCPVLGILMAHFGESRDNSPSLDRIIPKTGYVRNNIQVISMRANRIKADATLEELRAVLYWLERVA